MSKNENFVVDARNKSAERGGTPSEVAKDSYGSWMAKGLNAQASSTDVAAALGEANRQASVTKGSLIAIIHAPDSAWNDPEYWPVFDSTNYDSYLAGDGVPDAYVSVVQPSPRD